MPPAPQTPPLNALAPSLANHPDCLFCKILAQQIPAALVWESAQVVIFNDISPQAPTHWLCIHRQHTDSHAQTTDNQLYADLMAAARDAAHQQGLTDYRLVMNNGAQAGQSVFHMHLHLLAGRPLSWPPG